MPASHFPLSLPIGTSSEEGNFRELTHLEKGDFREGNLLKKTGHGIQFHSDEHAPRLVGGGQNWPSPTPERYSQGLYVMARARLSSLTCRGQGSLIQQVFAYLSTYYVLGSALSVWEAHLEFLVGNKARSPGSKQMLWGGHVKLIFSGGYIGLMVAFKGPK